MKHVYVIEVPPVERSGRMEIHMEYNIHPELGLIHRGNWYRIKEVMKRAEGGDRVTIGFLGGSITQGAVAEYHSNCYAHLVFEWWEKKFPKSAFTYANAGIGGTTSQFGVARVDRDLMSYTPDMVFIEYSVNDDNTDFFQETYEGLVRHVFGNPLKPAVALIHNIMYDKGTTAQEKHSEIGRHYDLPCIAMQPTIYAQVKAGAIANRDITPDDFHPNTKGHALVASVIIDFLEKVYAELHTQEEASANENQLVKPLTANQYEKSTRIQNGIYFPNDFADVDTYIQENGFVPDQTVQHHLYEINRNGWTASKKGASIRFEVACTELAVQYIKSVKQPAPIAKAVIDGNDDAAITLDANFDEDWGDCLYMQSLLVHGEDRKHVVEIEIAQATPEDVVPFYLVSLVASRRA